MNALTTPLDSRHRPPAPILRAPVRLSAGGPQTEIEFFVDTGADFSCLPASAVMSNSASPLGPAKRFRRGDGSFGTLSTVWATVELLNQSIDGYCAVTNDSVGLLGRDILQHFKLTLDGPAGTLTLEK